MSLEMVTESAVAQLLDMKTFKQEIGFYGIDEVHLALEWDEFHPKYKVLGELHICFSSGIPFLAMSASLHPQSRIVAQVRLGFQKGQFHNEKLPLDHHDLKYCARFQQHLVKGDTFPDLAWAIPTTLCSLLDLISTLFTIHTIEKVTVLRDWLVVELKKVSAETIDVESLVWPFHAEFHKCDCTTTQEGLILGQI